MKHFARTLLVLTLCLALALPAACGGGGKGNSGSGNPSGSNTESTGGNSGGNGGASQTYDPETRPVVFSMGAVDGVFNPFFSTTVYDGSVAGMTQISMLSTDANGEPAVGENEPSVVLDYTQTAVNGVSGVDHTTYEFVIKNGIKFSDGVPLTIMDVLFNLYAYLDNAYVGSSTIYSTDIRGLKAYRNQDPTLTDDSNVEGGAGFYAEALARINNIVVFIEDDKEDRTLYSPEELARLDADIALAREYFMEEVTTDWNNNMGGIDVETNDYGFTEDWQSYYLAEGIINVLTELNTNGNRVRKKKTIPTAEGGTREVYMTTLDEEGNKLTEEINAYISANINNYTDKTFGRQQLMKEYAINMVYSNYTGYDEETGTYLTNANIPTIIQYWATANTILEEFASQARSAYYQNIIDQHGGELLVKSISGITIRRADTFNGKSLGEEHDILTIVINGVDPKAIWNFGFTVTPMHYYSNAEQTQLANADYQAYLQDPENNQPTHFGVKATDKTFFDTVLRDANKTRLPVGAGIYRITDAFDNSNPSPNGFNDGSVIYYIRNDYFYTVGKGLSNAKIRKFRYKIVGEDGIMNALTSGDVDFGEPGATPKNIAALRNYSNLSYSLTKTGGYGYVGVNPKFVPEVQVRRAIMKAMNSALIIRDYYTEALAEIIYRPMSRTSWAYPKSAGEYYPYTTDAAVIEGLVREAGYTKEADGIYVKNGKKLTYTFTIAGETTDHPAYAMFVDAAEFLNGCGFDITVKNDPLALSKLATGSLSVWAAAWGSGIDPDMYQVYHKDSTATSTANWNYKNILNDTTGQFTYEYNIIMELSDKIEAARQTLNKDERANIYSQCLDLVMDLAVEFPTYQRNDLTVYNNKIIDPGTLNPNPSLYEGLTNKLWEVNYK